MEDATAVVHIPSLLDWFLGRERMKLQSRHSFLLPDSLLLDSPARAARQPHCPLADRQAGRSTMAAILMVYAKGRHDRPSSISACSSLQSMRLSLKPWCHAPGGRNRRHRRKSQETIVRSRASIDPILPSLRRRSGVGRALQSAIGGAMILASAPLLLLGPKFGRSVQANMRNSRPARS